MLNFKYKLFGRSKGRKRNKNLLLNNLNEFDFNIKKDLNKKSFNIPVSYTHLTLPTKA